MFALVRPGPQEVTDVIRSTRQHNAHTQELRRRSSEQRAPSEHWLSKLSGEDTSSLWQSLNSAASTASMPVAEGLLSAKICG